MKILLSPPVVFAVAFGVGLMLYWLGRAMAPKLNMTPGKGTPYACGEDAPMQKAQVGYRLFYSLAIFFTVMHVAVLTIATVPAGTYAFRALGYLVIIAASIAILYSDID